MQKQEKAERIKLAKQKSLEEAAEEKAEEAVKEPAVALAKTTRLVFFRQYNTYQALLEIHPKRDMKADAIYAKTILYIMRWFRNRLGEEAFLNNPEIAFLKEQYPEPEDYENFRPEEVSNIHGFNFVDFETAFMKKKQVWLVSLIEPDNGQERKDIQGRTFTTEISVYKKERSVVLGIKESCREPEKNTEDAFGYRPGFVRDIFYDEELLVSEQGIGKDYAFSREAFKLNGRSGEACRKLYEGLIVSRERQMPVLFVPEEYYKKYTEEVDRKTASLLGYCHVIVLENGCRKLFEQLMDNPEFVEVAEEGQLIFYRNNYLQEYPSAYFEDDSRDLLDRIKTIAQHEPLRKYCDFREYSFKSEWEGIPEKGDTESEEIEQLRDRYEAELTQLRKKIDDRERDNDLLQRRFDSLESENKRLDKEIGKNLSQITRNISDLNDAIRERDRIRDDLRRVREEFMRQDMIFKGTIRETKEIYQPLLHLPAYGREGKEEILRWIKEYYSDLLVVHPGAEKAFCSDKRNIDWHRFCMMIHYIAGYTKHRNNGDPGIDPATAREYDAEDSGYKIEPAGSGQGALEFHKDRYTISVKENGKTQNVLLDLHLKYGKGMDDNMIRIYFHYSPAEKKSILGYMPGHLPIRKAGH